MLGDSGFEWYGEIGDVSFESYVVVFGDCGFEFLDIGMFIVILWR